MITPPTSCFYVLRVEGEAAEFVTSLVSEGAIADIREAVLISKDYSNDIQATLSMDAAVKSIAAHLVEANLLTTACFNPLYIPSSPAAIDEMLDLESQSEGIRFKGMNGSPFIIKTLSITLDDKNVINGQLECNPFELPNYTDIIQGQRNKLLN